LIIVAISDTHGYHRSLDIPDGDILIHAGDVTRRGHLAELAELNAFFAGLPHRHKILIAGNHDWCFEREEAAARRLLTDVTYLQDEAVTVEGLKIYGSPWQPWFLDWAFNLQRGPDLAARWAKIPDDTDVLITHGPPSGIGDRTSGGGHAGCEDLLRRVRQIAPRLHVFGHIHEARGRWTIDDTAFVNACCADSGATAMVIELQRVSASATASDQP